MDEFMKENEKKITKHSSLEDIWISAPNELSKEVYEADLETYKTIWALITEVSKELVKRCKKYKRW